tara:strand:- start:845 stop:976 length:132 start_codon:yes stop_codon:yes gene_type:complete
MFTFDILDIKLGKSSSTPRLKGADSIEFIDYIVFIKVNFVVCS